MSPSGPSRARTHRCISFRVNGAAPYVYHPQILRVDARGTDVPTPHDKHPADPWGSAGSTRERTRLGASAAYFSAHFKTFDRSGTRISSTRRFFFRYFFEDAHPASPATPKLATYKSVKILRINTFLFIIRGATRENLGDVNIPAHPSPPGTKRRLPFCQSRLNERCIPAVDVRRVASWRSWADSTHAGERAPTPRPPHTWMRVVPAHPE